MAVLRSTPSVVVVGAGIAGASVAFALAHRGARVDVVAGDLPGEATAAGAGLIAPWTSVRDDDYYRLYAAGAEFYPELLARLGERGITRTDFRRSGAMMVSADPVALDGAQALLERRVASSAAGAAGDVLRLTPDRARARIPVLAPDLGGVLLTGGARVDGGTLRTALLDAAHRCGARIVTGRATLDADGRSVQVAAGGRVERLHADHMVLAAGVWTDALLSPTGRRIGVTPQRGQITHLHLPVETGGWPSLQPIGPQHYLVPFDDGRIIVGATREDGSGHDPRVTAAGQRQVLDDALSIAPGLAGATVLETRVGLRPIGPAGLPLIGPVPGLPALWVISGFGAGGLTMGPLVGDAVAASLVDSAAGGDADTATDTGRRRLLAPFQLPG